jgi:hypothetical protein
MINKILQLSLLIFSALMLLSCEKMDPAPDVSQPLVNLSVTKQVIQIGGQSISVGPIKDYEQGSDVVYKLTVSSTKALAKLIVSSSSGNLSSLSHVIKTDPDNIVDNNGNFAKNIKNATVYYSYHIDSTITPLSSVIVNFSFQNEQNYTGSNYHSFSVIKMGSTNGKPLNNIVMPFSLYNSDGIGTQENLDLASGVKLLTGELRKQRGPFYSIDSRDDIEVSDDAIRLADKVDFVGYKTKSTGTNPVLTNGQYYLVSPSDTVILTSTYVGASTTPDVQILKLRSAIRGMVANLAAGGKTVRKVYFKRLDNISGPNQVTAAYFDMLTHDNEFDTLLSGIQTQASTFTGPLGFDEVYGFVMDNGRRGLIRTISPTIQITTDVGGLVPGTIYSIPTPASANNLLCTIKYQDK